MAYTLSSQKSLFTIPQQYHTYNHQQNAVLPPIFLPFHPHPFIFLFQDSLEIHFDFLQPQILPLTSSNNKMKVSNISVLIVLLVLACSLHSVHSQLSFQNTEMEAMLQTIDSYFFTGTPRFNMQIRKFLRAAFHDCMGGCDGSINIVNTDNRGLEDFVKKLTDAYTAAINPTNINSYKYFSRMSRADFWVLAETRALAWGIKNANNGTFTTSLPPFSAGRSSPLSSSNGPNEPSIFPNAAGTWAAMLTVMQNGNPFISETDIVALLGLHGAGLAATDNSAFKGPWGPANDLNKVNNRFFISLLNLGFPQSTFSQVLASAANFNNPPPSPTPQPSSAPTINPYEWVNSGRGGSPGKMMLPIDMQIYHSFTPGSNGFQNQGSYCPQGNNRGTNVVTCPNTNTIRYLPFAKNANLALSYAKSNTVYLNALVPAFLRMVSNSPGRSLTSFTPSWGCVNRVAKCLGDILFTGCTGTAPTCR